ncbi:hypothetical protein DFH08DRAFT_827827 [Mycena albidolilacea]|uniref:Uncharacterized protein n=1 Tax=Mycena albidolilacea TaxID=1033008 RepID=A0AAD6YXB9_9AGAR|nr:hypothetical protein DFH08DRAFT_827827 [Mycena albidolilacea]
MSLHGHVRTVQVSCQQVRFAKRGKSKVKYRKVSPAKSNRRSKFKLAATSYFIHSPGHIKSLKTFHPTATPPLPFLGAATDLNVSKAANTATADDSALGAALPDPISRSSDADATQAPELETTPANVGTARGNTDLAPNVPSPAPVCGDRHRP